MDQDQDTKELDEEWKAREWEEFEDEPYLFQKKCYVVCADTLGKDEVIP